MLTKEQIKRLEELGFKGNNRSFWDNPDHYRKEYGFDVYIHVLANGQVMVNGIGNYPKARLDLIELAKVGIYK